MNACSAAEAVSGDPGSAAVQLEVKEEPGLGLRRAQRRESMLSLSAGRRLRVVRLGLRHRSTPLLGVLLRRRLSIPLLPAACSRPRRTAAAAAAARAECRQRPGRGGSQRRSLLLAATRFRHLDVVLRRLYEHRLRASARHGRRAVRLFLVG